MHLEYFSQALQFLHMILGVTTEIYCILRGFVLQIRSAGSQGNYTVIHACLLNFIGSLAAGA